jgi:hypothetical protein
MEAQRLKNYGVQVRERRDLLIPGWVCGTKLCDLFAQLGLLFRLLRQFDQGPLRIFNDFLKNRFRGYVL